MARTVNPNEEDLFVANGPEMRAIGLRARELVLSVMPDAAEVAENGNTMVHYSTGMKMADEVFYISSHKAHVNLGLLGGAELPDPQRIMEGTGKRLRHVKLHKLEDADNPALRALMETALEHHTKGQ